MDIEQELTDATDKASLVLGLEVAVVHRVGIPLGRRACRQARRGSSAPRRGVSQRNMHEHLVCGHQTEHGKDGGVIGGAASELHHSNTWQACSIFAQARTRCKPNEHLLADLE